MTPQTTRPPLKVRRARIREAAAVARAIRASFREYRSGRRGPQGAFLTARKVRRQMLRRQRVYGVATVGGQVVGAIAYSVKRQRLLFGPVGVVPKFRRFGIGKRLLDWMEARAKARRSREVRAFVLRGLPALIAFYRSRGYSIYRNRRGFTVARKRVR